ncbi:MAG: esterase [Oscillospiraceae bacterium]|nr:esterase [Oscillospiraceae bacterium]
MEKKRFIYKSGESDALLIQAVDEHELETLDREVGLIKELTDTPFTLAAFLIEDWNRELSPWEAPAVFGKEDFGSGAAETLSFITGSLLPELNGTGDKRCYIGGYSLAGLFALWAAYRTDLFRGTAAVSPSVWFPGWDSFMESETILSPEVYLSLGNKEEKTKNKVMASVGNNIRRQYELLCSADTVTRCELEWNPGSHFADPERRTAKGFAWLLNGQ